MNPCKACMHRYIYIHTHTHISTKTTPCSPCCNDVYTKVVVVVVSLFVAMEPFEIEWFVWKLVQVLRCVLYRVTGSHGTFSYARTKHCWTTRIQSVCPSIHGGCVWQQHQRQQRTHSRRTPGYTADTFYYYLLSTRLLWWFD